MITEFANEDTYQNLTPEAREQAVMKEILPFGLIAFVPIAITITIAFVFGPSM